MAEPAERPHLDLSVEVTTPQLKLQGPETTRSSKGNKSDSTVGSQLILLSER